MALLGTTLTSYVYVWETVQRGVEEPGTGWLITVAVSLIGLAFMVSAATGAA